MKRLLLATILGLSFSFNAFAGNNIFGVNIDSQNQDINSNVNAGYVAQSLSDTFVVQKLNSNKSVSDSDDRDDKYVVFGIDLKSNKLL